MGALATYHFGHLPVWLSGNAYFNGADVCKHEKDALIDTENTATAEIVEKDGKYSLETNIYSLLGNFKNGIINSDILGKAFEPEQRFENPDGSEIIFNKDYFDNNRGLSTIPGPFADGEAAKAVLY